jgi:sterol desaturase/sphingolipid hydroxylase (fatty acid hydroxylase superfamily)
MSGGFRFAVFLTVLVVMAFLEWAFPRRELSVSRVSRWSVNAALIVIDGAAVKLMAALPVPLAAVTATWWAQKNGLGLFPRLGLRHGSPLEMVASILVFDFAIYLQHWASHRIPLLWKFHSVHHVDRDLDVTSALRFHPVEIVLSMVYKVALSLALGPSPHAVVLFEAILNAGAMFNHANFALPFDSWVRSLVVTPDMHRIHHSIRTSETDSNYGFNLSLWDRMCGTYVAEPVNGQLGMKIGLEEEQHRVMGLWTTLMFPFTQ